MSMRLDIARIRSTNPSILVIGSHKPNIQAILDFDYLSGKTTPSVVALVTSSGKYQKYHWGNGEVLVPCYSTLEKAAEAVGDSVDWMFNMHSGRRVYSSTKKFFELMPHAKGGHIFAEDVPEIHALAMHAHFPEKILIGPAGVGMIIPGHLKLGVIGGVDWRQMHANRLGLPGEIAILAASGGMINEIITLVANCDLQMSFAVCFGGERFPLMTPKDAFLAAESDPMTTAIIYYGELGGVDEYEVAELLLSGKVKKPVIAYIAGTIGENFGQPVQFGHAKAMATSHDETATAKRDSLKAAGATVAASMTDFAQLIQYISSSKKVREPMPSIAARRPSLFTSTVSGEKGGTYHFIGSPLEVWAKTGSISMQITAALLGRMPKSNITVEFIEKVFLLSVDHGPQVSGAVATNIAARAGKGLVDSLAAGLLTIGPRFGGAVTDAAREWFEGVYYKRDAEAHVEEMAAQKRYIGGIGHKKYRVGMPDPRIEILSQFVTAIPVHKHYDYARQIERCTTAKKGSLILNVDGVIAALMLDILENHEGIDKDGLRELIDADFFNALFVIPRTVGFVSHYLDQKRLDEGLFRLADDDMLLLG